MDSLELGYKKARHYEGLGLESALLRWLYFLQYCCRCGVCR